MQVVVKGMNNRSATVSVDPGLYCGVLREKACHALGLGDKSQDVVKLVFGGRFLDMAKPLSDFNV